MPNEPIVSSQLNVTGIDSELYAQFKLCATHQQITIRDLIISFMRAFIKRTMADIEKKQSQKSARG